MSRNFEAIVRDLNTLEAGDFDDRRGSTPGLHRLAELCDEVKSLPQPAAAYPHFFELMERLSESELGTPGPLVHTMESRVGAYEELLATSVRKKPTNLSVWMVNRILNGKTPDREKWISLMTSVASHPLASDETRDAAQRFLKHQRGK